MRSDAPLIKHLYKTHGMKCALQWQRAPLVHISRAFLDYIYSLKTPVVIDESNAFANLPWDDVVLDCEGNENSTAVWLRVRHGDGCSYPWGPLERQIHTPNSVVIEQWGINAIDADDEVVARRPQVIAIEKDTTLPSHVLTHGHYWEDAEGGGVICKHCSPFLSIGEESPTCKARVSHMLTAAGVVLRLFAYFAQTPEYFVTVRKASTKLDAKTKMPWTRGDLEHIILVDPSRVNEYRPNSQSGTHASPRPHNRRGHWRRLEKANPDTRKVFVRPSWVGPTNWEFQGSTYSVVPPRASAHAHETPQLGM